MFFLIPLNLFLSDTKRQALNPSVLLCPVISPLVAFLSGFVARKSWNNSPQKSGQSLILQHGAGSSRQTAQAEQAACQAVGRCVVLVTVLLVGGGSYSSAQGCFQIQVTSCERKLFGHHST